MTDEDDVGVGGDATEQGTTPEQEAIAALRGTPVPGCSGFFFRGAPAKNGDVFEMEVVQDSTDAKIGKARGTTAAELVAHAQEIAQEFTED
jgi:hypothetical protein